MMCLFHLPVENGDHTGLNHHRVLGILQNGGFKQQRWDFAMAFCDIVEFNGFHLIYLLVIYIT